MFNCVDCVKDFCKSDCGKMFGLGAVAGVALLKLAKTDTARKLCVKATAAAMKFYSDAQEYIQNIKEDAEDLCYDAKNSLNEEETAEA